MDTLRSDKSLLHWIDNIPVDTVRSDNVIITPKRHRFGEMIALLLRYMSTEITISISLILHICGKEDWEAFSTIDFGGQTSFHLSGNIRNQYTSRPKPIINSHLAKSRSTITSVSVVQSFWNFAQSTAVSLPCPVQNFQTIGYLMKKSWANEFSRDLSLRGVSDGHPILHSTPSGSASTVGNIALVSGALWLDVDGVTD